MSNKFESIPDQTMVWNKKHSANEHEALRNSPSQLCELAEPYFVEGSRILELGCGVGRDAVYLAKNGHTVTATDASEVVIAQDEKAFPDSGVSFRVMDMQDELPYEDETFDVVYANLSLHYYLDAKTKLIVKDVTRVLKTGGIFAFACKSHDAQRTEGADIVESNVYVAKNGHATHMFTTDYAKELLGDSYEITYLDEVDEVYMGRTSGIVRCIAIKSGV